MSKAQVNKIERGTSSPTATLLGRLSAAFGLTVSTLLARAESPTPGRVARFADHPRWQDPATGYTRRQVAPAAGSDLPFELVHVDLPPGATVDYPAAAFTFIRQVVLVLDGRLTFVEGEASHDLDAGDSIELGPPIDRSFRNTGQQACTYLVAVSKA